MAGGAKPPSKGGKPFLADDDLSLELEAWDATFDALHGGPEASGDLPAQPVAPALPDRTVVSRAAPPAEDTDTIDVDFDSTEDAPLTLDAPLGDESGPTFARQPAADESGPTFARQPAGDESGPTFARQPSRTAVDEAALPSETDFSDVAAPSLDHVSEEDRTTIRDSGSVRRVSVVDDDKDDEIFTSASRPRRAPPDLAATLDEDIAPPPRRSSSAPSRASDATRVDAPRPERPTTPAKNTEVRSGPAIVRRVTQRPTSPPPNRDLTPPSGFEVSAFAEQTRVQHVEEIEAVVRESREFPAVAPAAIDDDAYDDIEIDADAAPKAEPAAEASQGVRRTAHVVRREVPTKPPAGLRPASPGPVIELDVDVDVEERPKSDAGVPAPAASEDDFSDVAAAVGAEDELDAPAGPRPGTVDLDEDLEDAPLVEDDDIAAQSRMAIGDAWDAPHPLESALTGEPLPDDDSSMRPITDAEDIADAPALQHTMLDSPGAAARAADRPPALVDLYPRVKTPTSVPALGIKTIPGVNIERAPSGLGIGPTRTLLDAGGAPPSPRPSPVRLPTPMQLEPDPRQAIAELEPELDLETAGRAWPEQVTPLASSALDEQLATALLIYEREVATLDDSATSAALRIEAGRLCERLSDLERARLHYDAALLADPRATAALRGLRRIARAAGDLAEATRHLETEIAVAGALERRPLGHYRVDLLMASGEQDMARVAVGEILDSAPSDIRALLAHLELAFLDGRAEEFGVALEQIAHAVGDHELRAAVQGARGVLAAHHNDTAAAATWFAAAAESDPQALAARLGAVRQAAAAADGDAVARALIDVARQIEPNDPITAAAAAIRAQQWATTGSELVGVAGALATAAAPADPLVARLAAERTGDAAAFEHWARTATAPAERAYAAARAAELDPAAAGSLWSSVLALDPDNDYAAAQLRTAHVAAEETQAAIDVDLVISADVSRDRARLRAAYGLIAQGQLDAAIAVLARGRALRPGSIAIAEALGEALAASGKWAERAVLFADLASEPGDQLDVEIAQLRSAIAWEEAVGAAAQAGNGDLQRATTAALEAWERVLERDANNPTAHAAAFVLANRLGDRAVIGEVLARTQAAEKSPLAAASLAFRRARLETDVHQAEALLRDLQPADDPRRMVALCMCAARSPEGEHASHLADAAAALEGRANQLDKRAAATEVAALRLRAAQLALDAADAARATKLLQQVEQALPGLGVVPDLLAAARRRAGDRPTAGQGRRPWDARDQPGMSAADAFARAVRDADFAAAHGDAAGALALYQRALEHRPNDPLATIPLVRVAIELRDPAPLTALALEQLRQAEAANDDVAKAVAYEQIAQIDSELRNDASSAQIALESASQADPSRIDLMHRLEQVYAANDELGELVRLRKAELATIPEELRKDRAALQLDIAGLATHDNRPEVEVAELYRAVLETDPNVRLALLHLESIVRHSGASEELAKLEEQIAGYFEGDAKTQAAFWTRSGETLAEIDQIDAAVQRFGKAEAALPGHIPALEGWRQAALKGQLWVDVAEAAQRQAQSSSDDKLKGALYHFAGVALMDKALVGEQAMVAFRRALEADPVHRDAFLRLRILLEEDANHDDLATLLKQRLEVEEDRKARIEMHRALAELHRNFLSDRETATHHYRAILDDDPNDLRSHAAVADIAWEQGNWQDAADALMARARLEREPEVLKTLCFRLGLIYADRLVDLPMALKAFQRALTYQPDDEQTLIRLADLAVQIGEWKLALGACERLVKNESDPDRRVAHLHRVAKIFNHGFGDTKRAERALNLALDSSPTNDDALQQLVQFYKDARDITSARVHLNRVAGAMRARATQNPLDGVPYRVIARAMMARSLTNVPGSLAIARAAAQLADLLGAAGEPELKLLNDPFRPDPSQLVRPEADEVLFPRGVPPELRQIFQLLGDRIAKHVGVNVQAYGVSRGDRVRAKDNPVAAVAQSVATALGFGEIDVYVSSRQPWAMVAEPTSPVSLILGHSIASGGGDAIRFAAGSALKMAQASLAIPARLSMDDLGVLVVALLRLFQPDFPIHDVDPDAVGLQFNKLRRLIPTNLMNELRPFALAIDGRFGRKAELARDLKVAGLRAGLVCSGSLLAGLRVLCAQSEAELPGFLADPVAQGLVSFALGEDHAAVAR